MKPLLISLLICCVSAQTYNVTSDWSFDQKQLELFLSQLNQATDDYWTFHWSDISSGVRYARQGFIDQQEIDVRNAGTGAGGGGFYVSLSPVDSIDYGVFPTAVFVEKGRRSNHQSPDVIRGTLLFQSWNLTETERLLQILGRAWNPNHMLTRDTGKDTWRVLHSAKLTARVQPGYLLDDDNGTIMKQVIESSKSRLVCELESEDFSRHTALFSYIGRLEMSCRLNLNEDLWKDVDTEKFEGYYTLYEWMTSQTQRQQNSELSSRFTHRDHDDDPVWGGRDETAE
ncbi:hypothetical protein PROFUN_13118, partial [Planoprotostelium fungivorum]